MNQSKRSLEIEEDAERAIKHDCSPPNKINMEENKRFNKGSYRTTSPKTCKILSVDNFFVHPGPGAQIHPNECLNHLSAPATEVRTENQHIQVAWTCCLQVIHQVLLSSLHEGYAALLKFEVFTRFFEVFHASPVIFFAFFNQNIDYEVKTKIEKS